MLIPIGHENMQARRWPVITIGLIAINFVAFLFTNATLNRESPELAQTRMHIRMLAAQHPELTLPPTAQKLVEDIQRREPASWAAAKNSSRDLQDAWDVRIRMMESPGLLQEEMDKLSARYDELESSSLLERYAFIPAHPTWYSYITANFLHGGWLHIIGNMWFLWLAGIVLEDAWGRGLYLLVYLVAGAFALQVHAWFNPGSNVATLGASGAVAALMGAFLVRFPTVKIRMLWLWGLFRPSRFSAEAYWLLPAWFLMEIFYGALFGSHSGVAHMAHVGGFAFGMVAAVGIRYSGLEHVINRGIEAEIDPTHEADLDYVHELITENKLSDALMQLERFTLLNSESERALLLQQEIQWRKNDIPEYAEATQRLCEFHLAHNATEQALKDYEDLVRTSGMLPASDLWMKICQALEGRQEYERALGEYQEIAQAYPRDRQSLMALMAGARIAMTKLNRPQQALNIYLEVAASTVPHMDLDSSIQPGIREARAALGMSAKTGT
jgi:membrane associated rhomboid family serine protease